MHTIRYFGCLAVFAGACWVAGARATVVDTPRTAGAVPPARRIVTLSPTMAKLVCAAGGCNRLVGVAGHAREPPQAAAAQTIGSGYSIDYEALMVAEPDLILAWGSYTSTRVIERLRRLKLRVEAPPLDHLADIAPTLRLLGQWMGTSAVADHVATRFAQRLQLLQDRYRSATPLNVLIQLGTHPVWTVNHKNILSAAVGVCGGRNVFADLPHIAEPVGMEALLVTHPDVVVYGNFQSAAEMRAYWSRMPDAPAARFGDLVPVDVSIIGEAAPPILDGIAELCHTLDRIRVRRQAGDPRFEAGR